LLCDARRPDDVPALVVSALVLGIIFRQSVKWCVRGVEGHAQIPGLLRLTGLFQELQCVVDIGDRCIEVLVRHLPEFSIEPKRSVTLKEVARTAKVPEIAIESEVSRFAFQVPFACHGGEITAVAKDLRRGDRVTQRRIARRDAILPS
jgi:hypothetical protein